MEYGFINKILFGSLKKKEPKFRLPHTTDSHRIMSKDLTIFVQDSLQILNWNVCNGIQSFPGLIENAAHLETERRRNNAIVSGAKD